MQKSLKIALAQLDFLVGDIAGNTQKIIDYALKARDELNADIVVFPELAITGYPPEDLLLRSGLYKRMHAAIKQIQEQVNNINIIVGYPSQNKDRRFNEAIVLHNKKIVATYRKQKLPNYSVFDEKRYFDAANEPCVINIAGVNIALTICEDLWHPEPMAQAARVSAQLMISINSSPFDMYKPHKREQIMSQRAREGKMPIVYVNCVGGQDELVFDGGSMVLNSHGEVTQHLEFFQETLALAEFEIAPHLKIKHQKTLPMPHTDELIYKALVCGVRDYVKKNHFQSAIIGLSGGIDSALTLAIAADAIGAENITTVAMPSRYTRKISNDDAALQARTMNAKFLTIPIEPIYKTFLKSLKKIFKGTKRDATEENIQARSRGILLMAISNKTGAIVLSTGNKSEMAVGYSTLYGDMVGGFCVLKDVPKTLVYRLAKYRNKISPIIPERVITRAPSAELSEDQLDQDSLPPYEILDAILERYIEKDECLEDIIKAGFDEPTVKQVLRLIDKNEYKRRQAPPGVRITIRAFGRDRRYPITSGFGKQWC